jgi:flagellar hook assembly protein FlgD
MQNIKLVAIPGEYALHYNYPNPFNPVTTMLYDLTETGHTRLIIYDLLGREVHVLIDKIMAPGYYSTQWNGRNQHGQTVGAGVYFYQIQSNGFIQTRKMLLLK